MHRIKSDSYIFLLAENVLQKTTTFILLLFVAGSYGPEKYGALIYVFSIIMLGSSISSFGIEALLSKNVLLQKDAERIHIYNSGLVRLIISAICLIALATYSFQSDSLSDLEVRLFWTLSFVLVITQISSTIITVLKANRLYLHSAIARLLPFLFLCISVGLCIYYNYSINYVAAAITLSYFVEMLASLGVYYFRPQTYSSRFEQIFEYQIIRQYVSSGFKLAIASMLALLYMKMDIIVIRNILGVKEAGLYALASQIIYSATFFAPIIATYSFPRLVAYTACGKAFSRELTLAMGWLLASSYFLAGGLFIFGPLILTHLAGTEYGYAGDVIRILSFGLPFMCMRFLLTRWIVLRGLETELFILEMLGMILNLILNIVLVSLIGINGAALATMLSFVAIFFALGITTNAREFLLSVVKAHARLIGLIRLQ